jgi:hypothetical protein
MSFSELLLSWTAGALQFSGKYAIHKLKDKFFCKEKRYGIVLRKVYCRGRPHNII